jgi:hypothetical protein
MRRLKAEYVKVKEEFEISISQIRVLKKGNDEKRIRDFNELDILKK